MLGNRQHRVKARVNDGIRPVSRFHYRKRRS